MRYHLTNITGRTKLVGNQKKRDLVIEGLGVVRPEQTKQFDTPTGAIASHIMERSVQVKDTVANLILLTPDFDGFVLFTETVKRQVQTVDGARDSAVISYAFTPLDELADVEADRQPADSVGPPAEPESEPDEPASTDDTETPDEQADEQADADLTPETPVDTDTTDATETPTSDIASNQPLEPVVPPAEIVALQTAEESREADEREDRMEGELAHEPEGDAPKPAATEGTRQKGHRGSKSGAKRG